MSYDIARIEREAERQFLSDEALAKRARLTVFTVKRVFSTRVARRKTLKKLVEALGLTADDVLLPEPKPEEVVQGRI